MNPRRAAAVGVIFIVIAAIYFAAPTLLGGNVDFAGVTMLIALGASMSIMAYVLMAGQSRG
ncbi:MAG: hypothetical protein A2V85_02680 [Chloroflexi bacterium RBG_16_72_14]|nr:MAG: hypothetical protein A2V85_02680 [Chloroflexi bacterium RBG_16_72_14]